jgi:hypothetical protein
MPWQPPAEAGKDVFFDDGIGLTLPVAFHEVAGGPGRTFRERGASEDSYATVHVQQLHVGTPLALDEAFAMVLGRLREQQKVDLQDEQLRFVGRELALSYVADVTLLDVPRRQWGVLVGRPQGLFGLFLTAPAAQFADSALDFQGVLDSLRVP